MAAKLGHGGQIPVYLINLDRDTERLRSMQRPLVDGEIGCYLSHLRLLEHIGRHETGWVCVLEDDLLFGDDFHDVVDADAALPSQGGVIKLDGPLGQGTVFGMDLSPLGRRWLVVPLKPQLSTGGYLVHAGVAAKLVARLSVIREPFDHAHHRYWAHGVPVYAVSPYPVRQIHIT